MKQVLTLHICFELLQKPNQLYLRSSKIQKLIVTDYKYLEDNWEVSDHQEEFKKLFV